MEISTSWVGNVLVAFIEDRLDGANDLEFQEGLVAALGEGDHAVVLNMEKLNYIGSAGLRVILVVSQSQRRRHAKMALCALTVPVSEVFAISGFDKIVPIHATQSQAINAVR